MHVFLKDVRATMELGKLAAQKLPEQAPGQHIFLKGPLGSGKTTFTRSMVEALPGGDRAEVSSPSFNIFNLYPTRPEVAHFDLYRLEHAGDDEHLMEYLDSPDHLVIIEWVEHLDRSCWPDNYLVMEWRFRDSGRDVELTAAGPRARIFLDNLQTALRD